KPRVLRTMRGLVALRARAPHGRWIARPMRIVTGRTRHLGLLKAFASPQILDLVADMVVFGILRADGAVIVVEDFTGPVAKGRSAMLQRIAVTLRAHFELTLAR